MVARILLLVGGAQPINGPILEPSQGSQGGKRLPPEKFARLQREDENDFW